MEVKFGNIVEVSKKNYVVVEANINKSDDDLRGDSYYAYQFKTISEEDFRLKKENPKEKLWTIKDLSSMHGPNEIRLTNIKITGKVKFKKETKTVYIPV